MIKNGQTIDLLNIEINKFEPILEGLPSQTINLKLVGLMDYDPISTGDFLSKYLALLSESVVHIAYVDLINRLVQKSLIFTVSELTHPKNIDLLKENHSLSYESSVEWGVFIYGVEGTVFYHVGYDEAVIYHKNLHIRKDLLDYIY